jgi:O-antigen/teichoic acid export membrane protein
MLKNFHRLSPHYPDEDGIKRSGVFHLYLTMGLLNQIAVNSLYRFIFLFLQFLITIILSRLAGPGGLGTYSLILANANILLIFTSLGVSSGISFHAAKKDISIGTLLKISGLSALIQLILILIVEYIHFSISGSYWIWPATDHILGIAGILFFFSLVVTERYFALYNGNSLFTWYNLQMAAFSVLTIITFCFLIFRNLHPDQNKIILLIILMSILQMICLVVVFPFVKIVKSEMVENAQKQDGQFFTYSMLAFLANSIQFLVYRIDFWILNYFHGQAELGLYALSVRIGQTLWILPGMLATIILPYITTVTLDKNVFEKIMRLTNTFNLLASAILGLLSFSFIPFIFGIAFSQSIYPFLIMIPGFIFVALHTLLAAYFAGKNKLKLNLKASLLSLITIIILDFLLIPEMGKIGAAIASTLAYSISGIYVMKLYAGMEKYPMSKFIAGTADIKWLKANFRRVIHFNLNQ